jgi:hypothetical protein
MPETEAEEEDGIKPPSERRISELTAFRTLALRDALANIRPSPSPLSLLQPTPNHPQILPRRPII